MLETAVPALPLVRCIFGSEGLQGEYENELFLKNEEERLH